MTVREVLARYIADPEMLEAAATDILYNCDDVTYLEEEDDEEDDEPELPAPPLRSDPLKVDAICEALRQLPEEQRLEIEEQLKKLA